MKLRLKLYWILCLIIAQPLWAQQRINAILWEPSFTSGPLLIFAKDGESPGSAVANFIRNGNSNFLKTAFNDQLSKVNQSEIKSISKADLARSAVLIANNSSDLSRVSPRVLGFRKLFQVSGTKVIVLPSSLYSHITSESQNQISHWIAENVPLLIAMGGDDVHPSLYGQELLHSKNTDFVRDNFEVGLIRTYLEKAKGFLLGICRGHQMSSVALGYSLIQDIPLQYPDPIPHKNDEHLIRLRRTTHSILYNLFDGRPLIVNSLHHQAVRFKGDGPLEVSAVSEDGIVEALELRNGHGLFTQFHPELMRDQTGLSIMNEILRRKNIFSPKACSQIYY